MKTFCQPQTYMLETPYSHQLLLLRLQRIALSRIFDFFDLYHYCAIIGKNCAIITKIWATEANIKNRAQSDFS